MNIRPDFGRNETVGLLLTPNFSMIAFSSTVEVLRATNDVSGSRAFTWRLFSPDGRPIEASNGIAVSVEGNYADAGPLAAIVVCSGNDVQKYDHGPLIATLRKLASHGAFIGAVCTGAYILAKAGLVDTHRCAIHWDCYDSFREEFPEIAATQKLFEIDHNRFTCAGGTASIDMMLALITLKKGAVIAAQVTDELIHHRMREANEHQRMDLRSRLGVSHPKLLAVIEKMGKRLENPISCEELARTFQLSRRQLERLFQCHLDTTPTRYYQEMRLNRARQLLRQTSMRILSVGLSCGFISASHFSKCYSEHFDRTPSEERRGMQLGLAKTETQDGRLRSG